MLAKYILNYFLPVFKKKCENEYKFVCEYVARVAIYLKTEVITLTVLLKGQCLFSTNDSY